MSQYYVYVHTNKSGTLYIGMTNDLERRLYEHKHKLVEGFTSKYNLDKLLYFETTNSVEEAIRREKQLKGWTRHKKLTLIRQLNPSLDDLQEILRQAQDDNLGRVGSMTEAKY